VVDILHITQVDETTLQAFMELGELLVESDWIAAMEYLKMVSFSIGCLLLGLTYIHLTDIIF
jgi:hypothetical protein